MNLSAEIALFGLAFCGLVVLELKTRSIWTPGPDITRDKWPVIYWIMVGSHILIAIITLGSAATSYLRSI